MRQIEQLQQGLNELHPFSGDGLGTVVVGAWGSQRPSFEILVLLKGDSTQLSSLSQRHEWLTQVLELTRKIGLGLSWQDVRFIHPIDLSEPSVGSELKRSSLDRPIADHLLLLVDGLPITNLPLLQGARHTVIQHHMVLTSETNPDMPFLRLAHALQECWHRLCLHAAVHPDLERHQFGWRLVLQSLMVGLLHLKPTSVDDVLALCELTPLERVAKCIAGPGFEDVWAEDHRLFLDDFQSLMELRHIKPGSAPVAMSQLTQRRYNRFFYRLLTHPNVDESLRYTLLS